MGHRFALSVVLVASVVGCSGTDAGVERTSRNASPIVGGTQASAYEEATLVDLLQNGQQVAACSGSVIAPKVVLTAGHCVDGTSEWQVTVPYSGGQTAHASSGGVLDYHNSSDSVDPNAHDVGLVFLDTAVTLKNWPALSQKQLADNTNVVDIGRIQDGQFSSTDLFVSAPHPVTDGTSSGFPYDYAASNIIESGDSGGPDELPNSTPHLIVSVNSGGGSGEVLARVDLVYSWIDQQVQAHGGWPGGSPPPDAGAPPSVDGGTGGGVDAGSGGSGGGGGGSDGGSGSGNGNGNNGSGSGGSGGGGSSNGSTGNSSGCSASGAPASGAGALVALVVVGLAIARRRARLVVAAPLAWLGVIACSAPDAPTWTPVSGGGGNQSPPAGGGGGSGSPSTDAGSPAQPDSGSHGEDAGSGGGNDSGGPPACKYPAGPYGIAQGNVVDPSLSWQGYAPGSSTVTTLSPKDFYDCNKSKGINAIVFDTSATWCGACQQEAQDLEQQMTSAWSAEGVAFVTLMIQDASSQPATTQTASDWISQYGLKHVSVVADPQDSFQASALPTNMIVDPRTMQIVSVQQGYGGPDPAVDQLAQKNK